MQLGGEWCNWDKFELIENNQGSDGGGPDETYYLTYFWPVTKFLTAEGGSSTDMKEDRLRSEILVWRYLQQEGVVGRYMRVYHPRAEGAPTPHTYLEIANAERTKAAIFQDALPKGPVVVYPKRLVPEASYRVAFRFGKGTQTATGAKLMEQGVRFTPTQEREIVLLNLDRTPGRGADRMPPSVPAGLTKREETWGGAKGLALRWQPSQDDVLVAEYLVYRDGKLADRVGTGTFYFDRTLGKEYRIVAVDGDGNRSDGGLKPVPAR